MAVKLNVHANVTGQQQLTKLNSGLRNLGTQASIAKARLLKLEAGAARARATFAALGTTLKVGVGVGLAAVTVGIGKFVKDTFAAGKLTESLQVRFKLLFNSATEGAKAFEEMNKFAGRVPFSLEAIAKGSGNLAVISKDASELSKILEVTGNVAAATGLDFRQTAEQIQRSFAGGIAAADVFRERGVRAMLGFEAGVKVSVEETKKKFFEVFANGGQYSTATKEFEKTLEAQVSFVQDAYFRFRQAAAKPLFEGVTEQVKALVGNFKENDQQLKVFAKRVGESLARGFENLGKFIKGVVENFDLLVRVIKLFIGLKIAGFIGNVNMLIKSMTISVRTAGGAWAALNVAMRANPLGLLVTAIQGAVLAFAFFGKEIKGLINGALKNFNINIKKLNIGFLKFKNALNIGDSDINTAGILTLQAELRGLENSWDEATKSKFEYLEVDGSRWIDHTKALEKSLKAQKQHLNSFRKDHVKGAKDAIKKRQKAEQDAFQQWKFSERKKHYGIGDGSSSNPELDRVKKLADAQNQAWAEQRGQIQKQGMDAGQLHRDKLKQVKEYREKLSLIGIDSKEIGGIIGDTWIEGIKQGNSLLETTKNSFKNVLLSITNTMVKRSAEVLVERLFNTLLDQRIMKQKQLNAATSQQGSIMNSLISKAGSLFSMGGGGGGGSKWGGLLSAGMSLFGGGGGSNLMGLGSAKGFFAMNQGGVVPGGAPYTDRVPAMLTPGEVVIPRDKANNQSGSTNITNINISGNVDERAINQIKAVISQSSAEVGGANRAFGRNSAGLRGRG